MRKARRHREELGEVIEVFADRPGLKTVTAFVLGWALFTGLTFIKPGEAPLLATAPGAMFAVLFGLILLCLSGERLVVCERGILVGSIAPGLHSYVIPYSQITLGSIAGITGANRYLKEAGLKGQMSQSTLRASWWTKNGVHFVACSAEDARRGRMRLTLALDPLPRSVDGRWIWFAGTGRQSPRRRGRGHRPGRLGGGISSVGPGRTRPRNSRADGQPRGCAPSAARPSAG
ncbi:hypothetical protein [Brevibacterium renqingii]|uniref:hypothetical protein n=1 Tax=Brevibacterium renqingii TaxID=2776916 RepID=UPI001ADF8113|nr:hypothetical protein [Brevibacterium renqingii]